MTHGGLLTHDLLAGILWRAAQAGARVHSCVKLRGMRGAEHDAWTVLIGLANLI